MSHIVLSGGGLKGLAIIGFMKALKEYNMKPQAISGASIGAIIGTMMSIGYSYEELYEFIEYFKYDDVCDFEISDFIEEGNTWEAEPDRYNVCGNVELNNLELAQMVADIMGKELSYELIPSESARAGYDRRYALDGSKMEELGWEPAMTFREALEKVVKWTLENPHWAV